MHSIAFAVTTTPTTAAQTCPHVSRKQARAALQGKTVAFVGDSVSRMMFCETLAWLFNVKGWWWQNKWLPGRSSWEPSMWNESGALIAAGCAFGDLLDCRHAPDGVACHDSSTSGVVSHCARCRRFVGVLHPYPPSPPPPPGVAPRFKVSERVRVGPGNNAASFARYGVDSADAEGQRDAPCADAEVGGVRFVFVWQRFLRAATQPACALEALLRARADYVVLSAGLWDSRATMQGKQSVGTSLASAASLAQALRRQLDAQTAAATSAEGSTPSPARSRRPCVFWRSTTPTTNELLARGLGETQPWHVSETEPRVAEMMRGAGAHVINASALMRGLLSRAAQGERYAATSLTNDPGDRTKANRERSLSRARRKARKGRASPRPFKPPLRSFYHQYNHPGPALMQSVIQALMRAAAAGEGSAGDMHDLIHAPGCVS